MSTDEFPLPPGEGPDADRPDTDGPGAEAINGADGIDELTARRDAILLGTLPDVAFDGWTLAALRRGAELAGFEPEAALASFPRGPVQAIEHMSAWADREMLARLAELDLDSMRVRDRVTLAVRTRLELLSPYKEAVRRSVAVLALPGNATIGPRLVYGTVDAIWYACGDTSTDYNFYSKRLLLSGVLTTTTLVWLDDRSEGEGDSWAFLDRRIEDVMRIGKAIGQSRSLSGVMEWMPNPLRFMRHLRNPAR